MQAVVLLSGGLDSTTVAAHAVRAGHDVRALSIAYGQTHTRELRSARAVAAALSIPLIEVDAGFYGLLAAHSALTQPADFALPSGRSPAEMGTGIPNTYVPLRNTFFVTLAAAALESWLLALIEGEGRDPRELAGAIFVGANAIDYSGYPDCRPEFFVPLLTAVSLGSKVGTQYHLPLTIETPIIAMSKADIVRHGIALGAPLALTWSCYVGGERPCGACDSCVLRAAGFAGAGIADPALQVRAE